MRIFFLFLLVLTAFSGLEGQEKFPADWTGNWTGALEIFNAGGKITEVNMLMEIRPMDTSAAGRYFWGLAYGSRDDDWRPYELVPVDPAKGLWQVDEKNGIAMESWYIAGRLLCWFVVGGNRILFTYEKTGPDTLVVEVLTGKESVYSTTKNTPTEVEPEVYEVNTYPFSVYQRAVLRRNP